MSSIRPCTSSRSPAARRQAPLRAADDADDREVEHLREVPLRQSLPRERRALDDDHLGDVLPHPVLLDQRVGRAARGQKPQPQQQHVEHADDDDGDADRRQLEHREGGERLRADLESLEQLPVLPELGEGARDGEVRRGADERAGTAEDGAEGEGHQKLRRLDARALRDAEDDGDEHRRRRRVLHHRGAGRGREHDEGGELELVPARDAVQTPADQIDDARLHQTARQDEESGDGDDDVVAEAGERLRDVERPRQHQADDEEDGDDVNRYLLGREEHERDEEEDEHCGDGLGHVSLLL
jgi:hypothetical protein